jgi:hypothetical protein
VCCIVLLIHTYTYSLDYNFIHDDGTHREFAESIAANPDSALIDLEGVELSPYVDMLGAPDELRDNHAILALIQVQRIAQRRVKSPRAGTK